ncbi:MAG: N-acetyl-gamma-glutamyl-phosphate reductase [Pseudomonadota bacterium]
MAKTLRAAVLGASGYTGAETIRLLAGHDRVEVVAASANALAGKRLADVFPHLAAADLPLVEADAVDWTGVDVAFGCLPHGASQDIIEALPDTVRVIDLSADYRLRDARLYEAAYGRHHIAPERTRTAVYGLTEHARGRLPDADVIACPGCYPTATLLALLPPVGAGLVDLEQLIVDAKSGVSGAGRGLKEGNLFSEAAEGLHPYGVGAHRHAPEIEQELAIAAGEGVAVTFTPHLVPMVRGELVTCYVHGETNHIRAELERAYEGERFVHVLTEGAPPPDTRHVRGTNHCRISVHRDRAPGRTIIVAVIDNLVKGSGGQAIQNLNAAMGWDEGLGLAGLQPLFP